MAVKFTFAWLKNTKEFNIIAKLIVTNWSPIELMVYRISVGNHAQRIWDILVLIEITNCYRLKVRHWNWWYNGHLLINWLLIGWNCSFIGMKRDTDEPPGSGSKSKRGRATCDPNEAASGSQDGREQEQAQPVENEQVQAEEWIPCSWTSLRSVTRPSCYEGRQFCSGT